MQFWCAILTVIFYTLILKALLKIYSCTLYIHTCLEYGVHVSTGVSSHVRFGVSVHSCLSYTYIDNQYIWEFVYNYVVWISLALRIWFYNCFRHTNKSIKIICLSKCIKRFSKFHRTNYFFKFKIKKNSRYSIYLWYNNFL